MTSYRYKLKIVVGFAQIASSLALGLELQWPTTFTRYVATLDATNVDYVRWTSLECIHEMPFYDKLLMITILPIVILFCILLFYAVVIHGPFTRTWSSARQKRFRRQCWKVVIFLMFLIYPVSSFAIAITITFSILFSIYAGISISISCSISISTPSPSPSHPHLHPHLHIYPHPHLHPHLHLHPYPHLHRSLETTGCVLSCAPYICVSTRGGQKLFARRFPNPML